MTLVDYLTGVSITGLLQVSQLLLIKQRTARTTELNMCHMANVICPAPFHWSFSLVGNVGDLNSPFVTLRGH